MNLDYTRADVLNEHWIKFETKLKKIYPADFTWNDFALQYVDGKRVLLYKDKRVSEQTLHLRIEATNHIEELLTAINNALTAYQEDTEKAIKKLAEVIKC